MKILQISPSYKPAYIYGGTIQSIGLLCEAICKYNEQGLKSKEQGAKNKDILLVFTTTANGKEELKAETGRQQIIDSVPVTYFKRWTKDHSHFSPGLLWQLREVLQARYENNEVILHIHAWWNLVSVLCCLVAKWYNVPVILSPRGMLTSYTQTNRHSIAKRIIHKLIGERLLEYCHIHATSEQEQTEILKIVHAKSISVIPNLVNLAEARALKAQSEADFFKLIFLSRIEEKKGLELLFVALSTLEIPWALTIAGSGEESYVRSLKQKAESLKLGDRVHWVGQVSNEDKFQLMADHDLLVLTSYNENFANVVIESLSVGTAVLISNKVGLSSYVKINHLGWITELNSAAIKNTINTAYENYDGRIWIRKNGSALIEDHYNPKSLTQRYLTLYQKVVSDANGG